MNDFLTKATDVGGYYSYFSLYGNTIMPETAYELNVLSLKSYPLLSFTEQKKNIISQYNQEYSFRSEKD